MLAASPQPFTLLAVDYDEPARAIAQAEVVRGDPEDREHRLTGEEGLERGPGSAGLDRVTVELVRQGRQHPRRERLRRSCRLGEPVWGVHLSDV